MTLPEQLQFASGARHQLRQQLCAPGRMRGGLLFGSMKEGEGVLEILLASPPGFPWWYADAEKSVLTVDERYVLGWSDCVAAVHSGQVDWRGNWIAYPDSLLPDVRDDLTWLHLGASQGLFDDFHVLVVVGWEHGRLAGRAYSIDAGDATTLECNLRRIS
ncbi:hypothetical protein E7T06_18250 [Deinococcus sp. Arct2-2]|nr:hypothetical protein E7T06_18250 [Deinococcus sp. Arct2-2]